MAAVVEFDGANSLIIVNANTVTAANVSVVDVEVDLYSDWKEWTITEGNTFLPAMRSVGGDPRTDVQDLGASYFLTNGWRIRPAEANHRLQINGNIGTDPPGDPIVISTTGQFQVLIENTVSNLIDSTVSRLDLLQLQEAIFVDEMFGVAGIGEDIGTSTKPSDNFIDARAIADQNNIRTFKFNGTFTLNQDYNDWSFIGLSGPFGSKLNLNNKLVANSTFKEAQLDGLVNGIISAFSCNLLDLSNAQGEFFHCVLVGDITISEANNITFLSCSSGIPGATVPTIDFGAGHIIDTNSLQLRDYTGGIEIKNIDSFSHDISLDINSGHVIFGNTNTLGFLVLRGMGKLTNTSNLTIDAEGFFNNARVIANTVWKEDTAAHTVFGTMGEAQTNVSATADVNVAAIADAVWTDNTFSASANSAGFTLKLIEKILRGKTVTDPNTGVMTVFEEDSTTILFTTTIFEDVGELVPYRDQGVDVRNRLE